MNIKERFSGLSKKGKLLMFCSVVLLGVLLLLFGGEKTDKAGSFDGADIEKYRHELEKSMKELCESVYGVSNVKVSVSLSGGFEYVYATDKNGKVVTVGSGSSASGIVIRKKAPEISGVGIVCSGGDSQSVKSCLISLISAAYGIGTNRIFVAGAKN